MTHSKISEISRWIEIVDHMSHEVWVNRWKNTDDTYLAALLHWGPADADWAVSSHTMIRGSTCRRDALVNSHLAQT
jgi:hypothetical protein